MNAGPALEVHGLRKVYRSRRRGDVLAVDDVSFRVEPGEVLGLLGPNGAGKTTTIKCICTLVRPTGGLVVVGGIDALRHPRQAVKRLTGVLEGNRNVYWRLTPIENLEFFAALQGIPARAVRRDIEELIERFGLVEKRKTPARMLSKGMQQKLALACAMVKRTPVLLLDEPTLGLDVEASFELRQVIKELAATGERTVVLSSHDMAVVEDVCERVVIIQDGRIVADDRVANLMRLFRARAYHFAISGTLSDEARAALEALFPLSTVRTADDHTEIEVEFPDPRDFYRLVDLLRDAGCTIDSIDRRHPDLEEIFLRIVKGDRA